VPIGWTSTHLHGGHTRPDADGWPDNMTESGREQLCGYDNSADNTDVGLAKVGAFLWYHDHAMNGTRHHVSSGLAGGYLVRDQREHLLGLPVEASDGEIPLLLADRNLDVDQHAPHGGQPELLFHETAAAHLNPGFRRLVHSAVTPDGVRFVRFPARTGDRRGPRAPGPPAGRQVVLPRPSGSYRVSGPVRTSALRSARSPPTAPRARA
jgi:hypothetical protein